MNEKENGSLAATAKGTVQSSSTTSNNTTFPVFQGENFGKAELAAVKFVVEKAKTAGDIHQVPLSKLSDEIVELTRQFVVSANIPRKDGGRELGWPKPKTISPVQAAQLVFEYEYIRMVCTKETVRKPTAEGALAMYHFSGDNEGIYQEIGDGQIDEWCEAVAGTVNKNWKVDFTAKLHSLASRAVNRVQECDNPNYIFMENGIFDYESKSFIPFTPDLVALRKCATVLHMTEPSEPVHTRPDGTTITFWEWIDTLAPYDGGRDLLIKLAGACLRSRHNWRVMVTLFNKTGHNGKSTFLDHLKSLVGYDGVMTSSLALLAGSSEGGRFGVSNIVGVSLITCEDSDSGAYIKDNSRLKSIISHDTISVERKNKTPFDYTPQAVIVCAANDIAKTKDKGQAWLDRNIYVPFTGQFIGVTDDKTIRSEWVVSKQFCEYMAYQALIKWAPYYELPEPQEALDLKDEWTRDNDPVVDFFESVIRNYSRDFYIPNSYAWEMYVGWLKEARPSTQLPSQKALISRLLEVATDSKEWVQPKEQSGSKGKQLTGTKWCPNLASLNVNGQTYAGRDRGIVRTEVWDWCAANNTTPSSKTFDHDAWIKHLGLEDNPED